MQQGMRTKKAEALRNGKRIDWEQKKEKRGGSGGNNGLPVYNMNG